MFDTEQMGYAYILKPYIEPTTHKLNQLCLLTKLHLMSSSKENVTPIFCKARLSCLFRGCDIGYLNIASKNVNTFSTTVYAKRIKI